MCSDPGNLVVLVVDDDPEVENLLRVVLTLRGCETLAASDGDEAVCVARNYRDTIHLLVTDVLMPRKMNGIELAARLVSERPGIRVVLMCGYMLHSCEIERAKLPLLPKPFILEQLYEIIDQALKAAPPTPESFRERVCPAIEHDLLGGSRNDEGGRPGAVARSPRARAAERA